jgi:hypothetical protein
VQTRRFTAVGLGAVAALVATVYIAGGNAAPSENVATAAAPLATLTTSDFRVVVTAEKAGNGGAPTALVEVRISQRVGGRWRVTDSHRLKGPYFWNVVTGPRAVCRLEIRTAGTASAPRPRTVVQLLQTPSVGCGPAANYPLAQRAA